MYKNILKNSFFLKSSNLKTFYTIVFDLIRQFVQKNILLYSQKIQLFSFQFEEKYLRNVFRN